MAKSRQFRDLFKNIGLLTLGNFTTKLLSFFLVPLYTSVLTTSEYGIYDIIHTTIILLVPVLTIDIQEAVVRFSISKEAGEDEILITGLRFAAISILIILGITIINSQFRLVKMLEDYSVYFFLLFSFTALSQVLSSFARGMDKVKDYTIASVISSTISILLNVWLLAFAGKGLEGYFISFIAGYIFLCVYLVISLKIHKYINRGKIKKELQHNMIRYSAPLVLNAIGWWLNSASDRYVVSWICGLAVNGIYSVGYKIPSILNIFSTIFNEAWILSAVKDFDPNDKDGFFVKTYNIYQFLMIVVCSGLIVFTRLIALILFKKDFYNAWIYIPLLNISMLFGALSGVIGGAFSAVKDSKIYSVSTLAGAVINIVFDILLVMKIGAIGAAIATMISYITVWVIRLICVKKYMVLRVNYKRDLAAYAVLLAQCFWLYLIPDSIIYYLIAIPMLVVILLLFKKELSVVINKTASHNFVNW